MSVTKGQMRRRQLLSESDRDAERLHKNQFGGPIGLSHRCCFNDTLFVYADESYTGPIGIGLVQDSLGVWSGTLAAMLGFITDHMAARVVYLRDSDCLNDMDGTPDFFCQRTDGSHSTVPVTRFVTLNRRFHWLEPPEERSVWVTTSFVEADEAALLPVYYDSSQLGIFTFLGAPLTVTHCTFIYAFTTHVTSRPPPLPA